MKKHIGSVFDMLVDLKEIKGNSSSINFIISEDGKYCDVVYSWKDKEDVYKISECITYESFSEASYPNNILPVIHYSLLRRVLEFKY